MIYKIKIYLLAFLVFAPIGAAAQTATSLLGDVNGDGRVDILAFGDSITRGEGDFTDPDDNVENAELPDSDAGYPLRVESWLHIRVANRGEPGESWSGGQALQRFIGLLNSTRYDLVVIGEGSNDARVFANPETIYRRVQTAVNVARASGVTPILLSIVPTCCNRTVFRPAVEAINPFLRHLAAVNELRLADVDQAFRNTCDINNCHLLSRPEGLHPNRQGYDVMAEVISAALLGIDLFAPDGPTLLAQALGFEPGRIRTVPNAAPAP
jgi:lysophospholipase L1-like esterase